VRVAGGQEQLVCAMCGGPRIPEGLGGEAAASALRQSKVINGQAMRARALSAILAMAAAIGALVLVALAASVSAGLVAKLIVLACTVVLATIAWKARARATHLRRKVDGARDEAWLAAAEDVAAKSAAGITAHELAARLHIDPQRADDLLTRLAKVERTRIDVGDDAELRYSTRPELMPGLRVDDSSLFEEPSPEDNAKENDGGSAQNKQTKRPLQ